MRKVISTLLFAGMFAFYSCGPNEADKAAADKATMQATQDSINAANAAIEAVRANTMVDTTRIGADTAILK